MKKTNIYKKPLRVALLLASIVGLAPLFSTSAVAQTKVQTADIAALYQLQAAFHAAASCAGHDDATKAQHLSEMLALWAEDGVLVVGTTTYQGRGLPSCGSGTLCDFFANHAGSFMLGRDWVTLAPLFKTAFDVRGDTANVYFECHYFDLATGLGVSHLSIGLRDQPGSGQARKVNGTWLLSYAIVGTPPLSCD